MTIHYAHVAESDSKYTYLALTDLWLVFWARNHLGVSVTPWLTARVLFEREVGMACNVEPIM